MLARVTGAATPVSGAGRTDAGVHARGMLASFSTSSAMSAPDFERALDALLPEDIGVVAVREAPQGFHALRDARWKWYRYAILVSRRRRVHLRRVAWRVGTPLDLPTMAAGLAVIRGRHDFRRFQKLGAPRKSTVRTVLGARVVEESGLVLVDVVGNGFLYGMVRFVVGTLVAGARTADPAGVAARMRALLEEPDGAARIGASAPAHGLTLMAVGVAAEEPPPFVGGAPVPDLG